MIAEMVTPFAATVRPLDEIAGPGPVAAAAPVIAERRPLLPSATPSWSSAGTC